MQSATWPFTGSFYLKSSKNVFYSIFYCQHLPFLGMPEFWLFLWSKVLKFLGKSWLITKARKQKIVELLALLTLSYLRFSFFSWLLFTFVVILLPSSELHTHSHAQTHLSCLCTMRVFESSSRVVSPPLLQAFQLVSTPFLSNSFSSSKLRAFLTLKFLPPRFYCQKWSRKFRSRN